jgi:uncharacterized membrane protein YbhN (UPF0104 family)
VADRPDGDEQNAPRIPLWARRLGGLIGLALLVTAIVVVGRHRDVLGDAWSSLRNASPLVLVVLAVAIAANLALTAMMLRLLLSRYGRVGMLEMQAVIAATALINYLPLRPGLVGRLTYHKVVNKIPVRHALLTSFQALGLTGIVAAYLGLVLLIAHGDQTALWVFSSAPVPVLAIAGAWRTARIWAWAALCRYLDVVTWAVRYYAVFLLLGSPIEPHVAFALACVSIIATMVPFVSNGLGLREWAIGLAAPLLTQWTMELSLTAELVNRAAELVVTVALGVVGMTVISKAAKSATTSRAARSPDPPP